MSTNPKKHNLFHYDETNEWKKFLVQLRSKALPHIKKHSELDAEDQLILKFPYIDGMKFSAIAKPLLNETNATIS